MYKLNRICVILPAYNAEKTLEKTYNEIPKEIVDLIVLVDDCSSDNTVRVAQSLGINTILHKKNVGYGGNQKTCYKEALKKSADVIIMLHPDYQYTPKLIPSIVSLIVDMNYDCVIASRILGNGAIQGGMPRYKYIANRILTLFQNFICGQKLSEYHSGYRAWKKNVLQEIPFDSNSDDFIFDNQMILQCFYKNYKIAEVSCPTHYSKDSSSINFINSVKYGFGVLYYSIIYFLVKNKFFKHNLFN